MRKCKLLIVIGALIAGACAQPNRPIPPGSYYRKSGDERIVVVPSRIFFRVNVDGSPFSFDMEIPRKIGRREYPYEVLPDGKIYFVVSSNDTLGLDLALDYEWVWQDGEIIRIDLGTGKTTPYVLRE